MAQRGAGAPLPRKGGGGGNDKPLYFLGETVSTSNGPQIKMVKAQGLRGRVEREYTRLALDMAPNRNGLNVPRRSLLRT